MIPDLFLNEQGGFVLTLLLSRIGLALFYLLIAVVALWILPRLVQRSVLKGAEMRIGGSLSERRYDTIARLMGYLTKATIIAVAALVVLSLFIDSAGLFTFLGLFAAGFGFSIRQIIGDYISGSIFLFENPFAIGDDIQISGERGKVEDVTLRTVLLRAPTGETRLVPNGDIRTVFNYTRALFGMVTLRVRVPAAQFSLAFDALEKLATRLANRIPALESAPQVLTEDEIVGNSVVITLRARARSDSLDSVRRQLTESIQQILADSDIEIAELCADLPPKHNE